MACFLCFPNLLLFPLPFPLYNARPISCFTSPSSLLKNSLWERLIWRSGLLYRNNPRVSSHLPSTSSPSESADFAIGVGSTSQVTVSSVFDTVIDHLCRGKTSFERSSLSAICPFLLLFPLLWRRRYAVRAPTSLLFPLQWHRRYESPLPLFSPFYGGGGTCCTGASASVRTIVNIWLHFSTGLQYLFPL